MRTIIIAISLAFLMIGCKGKKTSTPKKETITSTQTTKTNDKYTTSTNVKTTNNSDAVCILDKLSIRNVPCKKGKWLASMSIGEQITYTGEKVTDSISKKDYSKVVLVDGKEGWTRSDFIVVGGKVGAMLDEAVVYKRPDLLTKTNKKYSPMDIIAVMNTQGDWIRVKGKRKQGKYVEESWIKSNNISNNPVDIATAKYFSTALLKNDNTKKIKELQEITNNSDLSESKFIPLIKEQIIELQQREESVEPVVNDEYGGEAN